MNHQFSTILSTSITNVYIAIKTFVKGKLIFANNNVCNGINANSIREKPFNSTTKMWTTMIPRETISKVEVSPR